jgi:membrane associated rhomboid family serine protease
MFIIPLEKSIDWKNPPIVTILLILINSFVLFSIQKDDNAVFQQALKYYFNSELPEIEFPLYIEALEARGKITEASEWRQGLQQKDNIVLSVTLLLEMESDSVFMKNMPTYMLTVEDTHFVDWQDQRNEYEALIRQSVTWEYGFKPAEHRFVTFFSHMFLHGGVMHLVGNMIFLFLIGFTLEMALGSLIYLLFYLIGGLCAVTLFWGVYLNSAVPLVGASGAIAALMGLYSVIFGFRKIRFFYSLLFYFNYVKAPAIIMLFFWILNEFYQLYLGEESNIAYVAHIGGLIGGAALGLSARILFPERINTEYLDKSTKTDERIARFEKGIQLLRELKVDQAKSVFLTLHRTYPKDKEILLQLYKVLKFDPQSEDYHRITRRILSLSGNDAKTEWQVHETFSDYIKTTDGKIRIPPDKLLSLATRLARAAYPENAERILLMLLRKRSNMPGLADALVTLAYAWQRSELEEKCQKYLNLVQKYFPHSEAAREARQFLLFKNKNGKKS